MKGADLQAQVVQQLIELIELGEGLYVMPWHHDGNGTMPINVITRNPYRGGNTLILMMAGAARGFASNEWGTYKQWESIDAQVRKGTHGQHAIFWKQIEDKADPTKKHMFANAFTLFNAEQVDGYERVVPTPLNVFELDNWFTRIPFKRALGLPAYSSTTDTVYMPHGFSFISHSAYQAVMAHELTHWTGHESRLNRAQHNVFASNDYAMEELVAELGASFICAHLGLATEYRSDHAMYLKSWLAGLKAEPKLLWTVASKAQAALDHLLTYQPSEDECPDSQETSPSPTGEMTTVSSSDDTALVTTGFCTT